jgi:hypothetical protein
MKKYLNLWNQSSFSPQTDWIGDTASRLLLHNTPQHRLAQTAHSFPFLKQFLFSAGREKQKIAKGNASSVGLAVSDTAHTMVPSETSTSVFRRSTSMQENVAREFVDKSVESVKDTYGKAQAAAQEPTKVMGAHLLRHHEERRGF